MTDICAVAKHGDTIRYGENFFEPVADVDDADALPLDVADDGEQALDLVRGQRGGGFIHHDDARLESERLRNLHELLLRGGEPAARGIQIDLHAEPPEQFRGTLALALSRHEACARQFLTEENIFTCGQTGDEIELLIDHRHSSAAGILRRMKLHLVPGDLDPPGIGAVRAAEDFHQRALSSAILPEQCEHFAGGERKIHAAQRLHAGERLHDAAHREKRRRRTRGWRRGWIHIPSTSSNFARITAASGSMPVQY